MEARDRSGKMSRSSETDEGTPLTGKSSAAKASVFARFQAPLQSYLRPAVWIPGLNSLHSHREVWESRDSSPQENINRICSALQAVIVRDRTRSDYTINKKENNFLQIFVITRVEWLDVIEMHFEENTVKIWAFSSGFLPLCIPGACIVNVLLFWVPFLDMGMNKKRLDWIHAHLDETMERRKC